MIPNSSKLDSQQDQIRTDHLRNQHSTTTDPNLIVELELPSDDNHRYNTSVDLGSLLSLGQVIRMLRKALHLSQDELAARIPKTEGVSRSYLSRLESGKAQNPTFVALKAIARALTMEVESLIFLSLDTSNKILQELVLMIDMKRDLLEAWMRSIRRRTEGDVNRICATTQHVVKKGDAVMST